jgi:hypothetical protein
MGAGGCLRGERPDSLHTTPGKRNAREWTHRAATGTNTPRASAVARPDDRFRGPTAKRHALETFRVLAKGDLDADSALASAMGCPPPPRSLTPLLRPLSNQRGLLREGAALPRLSAGRSAEAATRWSRGCRCRRTAAARPRVPGGRRCGSLRGGDKAGAARRTTRGQTPAVSSKSGSCQEPSKAGASGP